MIGLAVGIPCGLIIVILVLLIGVMICVTMCNSRYVQVLGVAYYCAAKHFIL